MKRLELAAGEPSPLPGDHLPAVARIHRLLAAAVAEAGRTLGRGVSFEALLAGLTDGRDVSMQIDLLGIVQSARGFGLVVERCGAPAMATLGTATHVRIDPGAGPDEVLLFPATELADERRAMRFRIDGMRQPFVYEPGDIDVGDRRSTDREAAEPFSNGPRTGERDSSERDSSERDPSERDPSERDSSERPSTSHEEEPVGTRSAASVRDITWLRIDRLPYAPQGHESRRDRLPDTARLEWLWAALREQKRPLRYALLASFAVAVLGLVMPLFSMVLFNTVAPNGATATLFTLAVGMLIAAVADFVLREVRAHVVDVAARHMDVLLSRRVFEHLLDIKLEAWRGAAGTQADMLRGFSTVQEVFTSSVLLLFVDLPFGLLALAMVFVVGGHLGWVPVGGMVMLGLVSWRLQASIASTTRLSMRLGQERHGTLVEAIHALEAVRAVGGERVLRRRWRDQSAMAALAAGSNRRVSQLVNGLAGLLMQVETLALLVIGAWMVGANQLTLGALVAANLFAGRALAPFSQIIGLAMRLASARTAAGFMSRFFAMPTTTAVDTEFVARSDFAGGIALHGVGFTYPATAGVRHTLAQVELRIAPGERVAVLGRMGSGKSTLLKLMAGVITPQQGCVRVDGADMSQLDRLTRRRVIGYLQQEPFLVSGSLKENIAFGHPDASDAQVLQAARLSGVDEFARLHPDGYSMRIEEGGRGLSQGQKQAVGLAQILLHDSRALLLDEPSSAFDMDAERRLVQALAGSLADRTLVVVTHRPAFLQLVTRVVVIDEGRIVLDGPRDEILRRIAGQAQP